MDLGKPLTQRRRSERVSDSLPVVVRGIDLLGQPFEERTSTLNFNLHGCRYASKHHLPKNTWITLELARDPQHRNVRARVAWIQRPHSVREFFQIAVELESPANIWGLAAAPEDWASALSPGASLTVTAQEAANPASGVAPVTLVSILGKQAAEGEISMTDAGIPSSAGGSSEAHASDHPLFRDMAAELNRQAAEAAETVSASAAGQIARVSEELDRSRALAAEEFARQCGEEAERLRGGLRHHLAGEISVLRKEFLGMLRSDLAEKIHAVHDLVSELTGGLNQLRAERQSAEEAIRQFAEARMKPAAEPPASAPAPSDGTSTAVESAAAACRQRLESEIALARDQWNELLQCSLDSGMKRLAERMAERSQEALSVSEQRLTASIAELQQPLSQASAEARDAMAALRSGLGREISAAREVLAAIERSNALAKESAAEIDAASAGSLGEFGRRIEGLAASHVEEMTRQAQALAAELPQRVLPALDSLGNELLERTAAQIESRIAPRLDRVPELLREFESHQTQAEETLRLQRERLRQISENAQREASARAGEMLSDLRAQFESARTEALVKWSTEMETSGATTSKNAAEAMARTADSFEEETRTKLASLARESLGATGAALDARATDASRLFAQHVDEELSARTEQAREWIEGVAAEAVARSRSRLGEAAESAAASFGEVLRGMAEREVSQFSDASRMAAQEREQELQQASSHTLRGLHASAAISLEEFRAQMASHLDGSIRDGRAALASEFGSALEGYRAERDAWQNEWTVSLNRLSAASAEHYRGRLQADGESWVHSSVQRLNESGQDLIESLTHSADTALRDSCSKIFEALAGAFRDQASAPAAGIAGFTPALSRDIPETPMPHNEAAPGQFGV